MTMLRTWSIVVNPASRTVTRSPGTKPSGSEWAVSMTTRSQPAAGSSVTASSPAEHGGGNVVDVASGTSSSSWACGTEVVVTAVGGGTGSVAAVWVESHVTHSPSPAATTTTTMATPAAHPFIDEATY